MITISLHIVNTYEDGKVITTVVTGAEVAAPPSAGDLDDWAEGTIYPLTGTGRSDGDAWYDATITASSEPSLVGTTYEFGYSTTPRSSRSRIRWVGQNRTAQRHPLLPTRVREVLLHVLGARPAAAGRWHHWCMKARQRPRRASSENVLLIDGQELRVTNPDRVLYPATGTNKLDVINYYRRSATASLPHLRGRARHQEAVAGRCRR